MIKTEKENSNPLEPQRERRRFFFLWNKAGGGSQNTLSKESIIDQSASIYRWNHTCKFLVLSSVWAGVLQQVSEEMLVPELERASLIHSKIPRTAGAPPVSDSMVKITRPGDRVNLTKQFWSYFNHINFII